ncbi:MAG: radical SAM family heme chaperone HemW [Anaerovoracaceae bacterium]
MPGLYIHIPFCAGKCIYCDFASYADCGEDEKALYFKALYSEIDALVDWLGEAEVFDTVFIGGGTPSVVDSAYICEALLRVPFTVDAEVTIEANPGSLTSAKAESYAAAGVNRISLGVQSMIEPELSYLGRVHDADMAAEAVSIARDAGINNINIDLIFGFPGHTLKNWKNTVEKVLDLQPEHISFYSLQIEEGTPLYEAFRLGKADQIPEELDREMYHYITDKLRSSGYRHYEISNAALSGRECRHNLKYWSMSDYVGVGAAAHSFINGCRFENPSTVSEYIKFIEDANLNSDKLIYDNLHEMKKQKPEDLISDCIFTSLRTASGIDLIKFSKNYGIDLMEYKKEKIASYISDGFMLEKANHIFFTPKGIDISNSIITELI